MIVFLEMNKQDGKIRLFFKHIWYELEPLVIELFIYSVVIFLVSIVGYYTKPYLDEKLKEAVDIIKWVVVIAALSLFAFHTIVKIFIRMCVGIFAEGKDGYDKIKQIYGKEEASIEDESKKTDNVAVDVAKEDLLLNSKSLNIDEVANIQKVEQTKVRKGRIRK